MRWPGTRGSGLRKRIGPPSDRTAGAGSADNFDVVDVIVDLDAIDDVHA